ncbi:peptidase C50, separase [Tanacetum coccineum]
MLPWESMKELENQDTYRMPSVSSIFYTYQKCDKSQRKAVRDRASYATLDPFDAYYVTNPTRSIYGKNILSPNGLQHMPIDELAKLDSSDLVLEFTQKLLKTFEGEMEDEAGIVACLDLARKTSNILSHVATQMRESSSVVSTVELLSIDGRFSRHLMGSCQIHVVKEISKILKTRNLFIYVGHGDGLQHMPIDELAKLDSSDLVLEFTKKLLRAFEGEMEDEVGIVACLDLARKTSNILCKQMKGHKSFWPASSGAGGCSCVRVLQAAMKNPDFPPSAKP